MGSWPAGSASTNVNYMSAKIRRSFAATGPTRQPLELFGQPALASPGAIYYCCACDNFPRSPMRKAFEIVMLIRVPLAWGPAVVSPVPVAADLVNKITAG